MRLLLLALLVSCAYASPQYVKSRYSGVKGGYSGPGFQTGENLVRYNNTSSYGNYSPTNIRTERNYEKGVCYIEVPTSSLVKDPTKPVPAGNGSLPHLSRIRTCCQGYTKNIHNFKICDPVCAKECVNALCTEPETCTCFPDHVKNLAGFCIPTCPIGCQNGQCAGGECICKDGYRLDSDSKFCIPHCTNNCGGIGNCTAPSTCECRNGYRSTPEGSCKPHCDRCGQFAECIAPNDCRCRGGYTKNQQGNCVPQCAKGNCGTKHAGPTSSDHCTKYNVWRPITAFSKHYENSNSNCQPNGVCVAPNICNYLTTTTTTAKPGYQQPAYPGYQQPGYPGYQQPHYPNLNPGQSYQPGNGQSYYPGNQPSYYPGNQHSNYPNNPDQQTGNTGLQPMQPGNQPPYYTGQNPSDPNRQPIYISPSQQPSIYPGNQHGYYDHQRPDYPNSQQPNSPSNNGNDPYYPGSQYYPGNSHYYPGNQHYPQQQNTNLNSNQSHINPSYTSHQQSENLIPDNQLGNVETLCSKPCINGVCVGQDRCTCNEGYVLDDTDPTASRCKPYCPGGCPNGVCSSPYFCICNLGYYKDRSVKGRANCVKRIRRSADDPINVAELLVFEIPDDDDEF